MKNKEPGCPAVLIPPPLVMGVPLVVGLGLQWFFPLHFLPLWMSLMLGIPCIILAVALLLATGMAFWRARTSMFYGACRVRALIVNGPFRFTRNPLFVGLVLLYAGISVAINAPWPLLFLPVVVILLHWGVIIPEECYLENKFGDEYRKYKNQVRRWL